MLQKWRNFSDVASKLSVDLKHLELQKNALIYICMQYLRIFCSTNDFNKAFFAPLTRTVGPRCGDVEIPENLNIPTFAYGTFELKNNWYILIFVELIHELCFFRYVFWNTATRTTRVKLKDEGACDVIFISLQIASTQQK